MNRGLGLGKKSRFYGWLKLMACSNTCGEQIFHGKNGCVKKMAGCHIKSRFFIVSKGADLSLDVWPLIKAFKPFLQNICLLLDLLYHKRKPLIMIALCGSIL